MWLFYVPIGLAILLMMVRYRSLSAPLKANPGMERGGLFPRSKQDFFERFPGSSALIPVSLKLVRTLNETDLNVLFEQFCARLGGVPERFVLKPDEGIQGQDIHFFENAEALAAFWQSDLRQSGDWLLQEYVGGMEAAIFYNQPFPGAPGRILSMTQKHGFPVTGDGVSTIGELIGMADADRATRREVAKTNRNRIDQVPEAGLEIDLIPVRNHHMGATFQDISEYVTPQLEAALCAHLDPVQGFQYGRLDCRVPDFASLKDGRGIKALEINALYSEPVHAYDPKYGLLEAYRIFISHWHAAIKTGLANMATEREAS